MKKILVVVDMQNDFVDGALGSAEAVSIVDKVVNKINEFDGEIIVTYDTHLSNYMETREGKYLPVPHCIENTNGWLLNSKVEHALVKHALVNKNVYRIKKPTFGSVKLVNVLSNVDEINTEITFVGLCTDICVVSNAMLLKANYPEMDIIVDASCCAGVTPEKHAAALEVMKSCQINIVNE